MMSLRDHWTVEPQIGDLYSTPICYLKQIYSKEIERIGFPGKDNLNDLLSNSKNATCKCILAAYKHFIENCAEKLAKVVPFMPEFLGFQVAGKKLTPNDSILKSADASTASEVDLIEAVKIGASTNYFCGPRAELSDGALFLSGAIGDITSSMLVLKNTGSTSLYFYWEQVDQEAFVEKGPETSHFKIIPDSGSVLPGEVKIFFVGFYSICAGTFLETWALSLSPTPSTLVEPLNLRGMAILEDTNRMQRELLKKDLEIWQCCHGIDEVMAELIDRAVLQGRGTFGVRPQFVLSTASFAFIAANESFEPPVYYDPALYLQLKDVAVREMDAGLVPSSVDVGSGLVDKPIVDSLVLSSWGGSISNLMIFMNDRRSKNETVEVIERLVALTSIPSHPSSLFHAAMYKALKSILVKFGDALADTRTDQSMAENGQGQENGKSEEPTGNANEEVARLTEGGSTSFQDCTIEITNAADHAVKLVLKQGVELFFYKVDTAVASLMHVVKNNMERLVGEDDAEAEAWIQFWVKRLADFLSYD